MVDLVNLEDWQNIQDSFSDSLGITLRTVDLNGKFLSKTSGPNQLHCKISNNIPNLSAFCGSCILKPGLGHKIDIKNRTVFKCPFDLDVFVLPIKAHGNRIVAYIILGPLIPNKRKERDEYVKYAEKTGIDPEKLVDALIEINVFSYSRIRSIIKLISDIFSYMAQTGYHKKRLGEIAPEVIELDPLFSRYYEQKVLNALLNTCSLAFDADSGSVMTLDKNTNMLSIKVASKLEQNIIDDTNIKVGEGIAGVAAATAEPVILPKDEKKNGLSEKMKRKYIKSSMIVPFSKATANNHDVYGVINLNVVRKDRAFSEKDIKFVKELIKLASIALIPVK
ncbi:MAG: PocR ligand-binding domain-containing protein [Candidatus Omnitrophica bacterium]|nr:PocR ligand-binding domain-containing protein [Candidatus Omnitrophota bacterium]